jgi:peptidoglycan hydrolase-like protein with peptidoglycan-binding domain
MKVGILAAAMLALALSACTQSAKPVASSPPPPVTANTPPQPEARAAPPVDAAAIALARRDLKALGYSVGKSDDTNDASLRRAILAFEKDQDLTEDGQLSPILEERLKQLRSAMSGRNAASANRNALFVYSDGTVRNNGLDALPPVPPGLTSDAPAGFLRPPRPASEASYHLGYRVQGGGFAATKTVNCHTGHLIRSNAAFGGPDLLAMDCSVQDDAKPWHSLYSPVLDTVVEQDSAGTSRMLIAIRPPTANWPAAARTGLDWAITHALEAPNSDAPVAWSSTGVARHFEVRAFGKISGQELGLAAKFAGLSCRRFELAENDRSRYPGIACQHGNGGWTIAGTGIALSSPARTMWPASAGSKNAPIP